MSLRGVVTVQDFLHIVDVPRMAMPWSAMEGGAAGIIAPRATGRHIGAA
jgi:hypothetical protein